MEKIKFFLHAKNGSQGGGKMHVGLTGRNESTFCGWRSKWCNWIVSELELSQDEWERKNGVPPKIKYTINFLRFGEFRLNKEDFCKRCYEALTKIRPDLKIE
jgi:hypothetical protein